MNFRDRRGLRAAADRALSTAAVDPGKLMLVYSGTTAALLFLVTALNFVLQGQIAGTGGLSGVGTRALLETAIELLQVGVNLLVPFWTMGYVACVLRMVRGQQFGLGTMLDGFRHFGPVLRLTLMRGGYFLMIAVVCLYPSMMIFLWTPLADAFNTLMDPYIQSGATEIVLDDATLSAVSETLIPAFVIYGILFLLLAAPQFYRFRMADLCLMDDPGAGAMAALRRSTAMMHRSRMSLLKLDLSFWWFYLLDLLTLALCYGDAILEVLGITLPIPAEAAYFLFYGLYLAAQLGLYVWARNRVECTYAAGYEEARQDLDQRLAQYAQQTQNRF